MKKRDIESALLNLLSAREDLVNHCRQYPDKPFDDLLERVDICEEHLKANAEKWLWLLLSEVVEQPIQLAPLVSNFIPPLRSW